MNKTVGILAHVDAGKTTLGERVLFLTGTVRTPGRVDHGDTSLDTDPIERARGITIYATTARLRVGEDTVYWLDTPGHTDFTPEMERAMAVMDAAVLVVSASAGVQPHTETLWRLLEAHGVPTLIFLNKTDLPSADTDGAIAQLRKRCSGDILDLREWQQTGRMPLSLMEETALRDESLLDLLDEDETPETVFADKLAEMTAARKVFPLMAGSALTGDGVDTFLPLLNRLVRTDYDETAPASGVCWKVGHDGTGLRLCQIKLLSGHVTLKDSFGPEKLNDLRRLDGVRMQRVTEASAGDMIIAAGCEGIRAGDAIGDAQPLRFSAEPMMSVEVFWEEAAENRVLQCLRILEDEEPTYRVEAAGGHVSIRVMGAIQLEILRTVMKDRFGIDVRFGEARVLYRETVAAPVIGIGHYEPLRHYAEVWLRLVPLPTGSGIRFRSLCHVDDLPLHFQRLIETHVFEKEHRGVLTGAPLADVEVQLLCGRAHLKHTEGGDFRQAVYRAIRNALMQAESVLLEPIAAFELRVPSGMLGTVMGSLQGAGAEILALQAGDEDTVISGEAPYAPFRRWQENCMALTRGKGILRTRMSRYAPCADPGPVIAAAAYQPLADPDDSPDSVFCSHGAGFTVAWDHVRDFAHCSREGIDSVEDEEP